MDLTLIHHFYIIRFLIKIKIGEFGNYFDTYLCVFSDLANSYRQIFREKEKKGIQSIKTHII